MKRKARKITSLFMALTLVLGLFAAMPLTAYAAPVSWNGTNLTVADTDVITLNGVAWAGGGTLTVPANATVTIDGTVAGATNTITLDIAAGATVEWEADYSGTAASDLILITGTGEIEAATGSSITQNGAGDAVFSNTGGNVTVSGGTVSATTGIAIQTSGNVNISGGMVSNSGLNPTIKAAGDVEVSGTGEVKNTGNGYAISATAGSLVKISGGTVSSGGICINTAGNVEVSGGTVSANSNAIYATGPSSTVEIKGGIVKNPGAVTASAIRADGGNASVMVSGGTVSSPSTNETIYVAGDVTVSGTLTGTVVENTGTGTAIKTNNDVEVSGGTVKNNSIPNSTINANGDIEVSGGQVANAGNGYAIYATAGSIVDISGGLVSSGGTGIYTLGNVTVSGTNTVVSATNQFGEAINSTGTVNINGGTVKMTGNDGYAINSTGTVNVSGGEVQVTQLGSEAIKSTGVVSVTGGTVTSERDGAAINTSGNVTVSQPTVTLTKVENTGTGNAIYGTGATSTVIVSGGSVSASGTTINTAGSVTVSGGMVSSNATAIGVAGDVTVSGGTVKSEGTGSGIESVNNDVILSGGYVVAASIDGNGGTNPPQNGAVPPADLYLVSITGNLPNGSYASPAGAVTNNPGFVMDSSKGATTGYNKAWMPAAGSQTYTINAGGTNYTATGAITATGPNTLNFTAPSNPPPPGGGGGGSSTTNASISPIKADFDKNGGKDISVALTKGSYTLQDLKNGSYILKNGTDYTVSGNKVTIKAAYLNTLAVGEQAITFDMSGGTDPKLTVTVKASTYVNPFTDVKEGAWYYDAVKYVYENGLIIGTAADKFSPDSTLTRGMIVTILYRNAGEPDVSGLPNPFDDVAAGQWYTNAVKWAADNGIVSGYGNGKYGPDDPVTKEQLAAILYRTQQATGKTPANTGGASIPDAGKLSVWAKDAVNALNNQGIFKDIPGDSFSPQTPASRAEVASMLYRYLTAVE